MIDGHGRRGRVTLATTAALLLGLLAHAPSEAAELMAAPTLVLRAGPDGPASAVGADVPEDVPARAGATFKVTYTGFPAAARQAFQRAVNIWAQKISSPVTITVEASYEPLGPGVLGSARAGTLIRDFAGAPLKGTWYGEALADKLAKRQLNASPDIVARFSSVFPNWHFGSGAAPARTYDFTSVVLHELGHGLGFSGGGRVSGSQGTVRLSGFPFAYDAFTENGAGKRLLTQLADPSAALAAQLQGGQLFFDGPKVLAANGGQRARLFAPSTFRPGSSYSHLDEATYPRGNPNSLMTPALGQAETIRNPGPITLAIFRTLGW